MSHEQNKNMLAILFFFAVLLSVAYGQTYTYISPATTNHLQDTVLEVQLYSITLQRPLALATVKFTCVNNTAPSYDFIAATQYTANDHHSW